MKKLCIIGVLLLLVGCKQKPQLGDVRYKDGELQCWKDDGDNFGPYWVDMGHEILGIRLDHQDEWIDLLKRQLACLEAGVHEYEYSGYKDCDSGVWPRSYIFNCPGCDKEYSKIKFDFGEQEKAAMREFCGLSDEGTE